MGKVTPLALNWLVYGEIRALACGFHMLGKSWVLSQYTHMHPNSLRTTEGGPFSDFICFWIPQVQRHCSLCKHPLTLMHAWTCPSFLNHQLRKHEKGKHDKCHCKVHWLHLHNRVTQKQRGLKILSSLYSQVGSILHLGHPQQDFHRYS